MRMIRWMWVVTKLERMRGSRKWEKSLSPGKEVEVVWACDEKIETLCRKEGDENGSTPVQGRRCKA